VYSPIPQFRRYELLTRKDKGVGVIDVWKKEVPRRSRLGRDAVRAYMRAPDHNGSGFSKRLGECCGLGIVEDHNIPWGNLGHKLGGVACKRRLVDRAGILFQTPVSVAVELIVKLLRHGEELWRSGDHNPSRVEARSERIRHERTQHLRNSTPDRGRIDEPDSAPGQARPRGSDVRL
jgi:hypothetical protein